MIDLTKDVDIHSGSGTTAAVGGFDDISGTVISLCLGDGNHGVSWLGVDGHPVVWFEDQVGFGPLDSWLRLTCHISRKFNLAASLSSQTSQKLGIQLDLWRLCIEIKDKKSVSRWALRCHSHNRVKRTASSV